MSDHNECPTCLQDWVANTDYECGCCGRPASEHIRVTSLCRILRETQQRENALIVERDKLQRQLATERDEAQKHVKELYIEIDGLLNSNSFLQDALHKAREQYRLSSVCRELRSENERLKRIATWPHDPDPFTSPDHDNDSRNYP
jgi:septal ring factor EnvC (AmiA/AmiB activator)